jgi:hypothetical protein
MVLRAATHVGEKMVPSNGNQADRGGYYRCAGPNCGIMKKDQDRWWLMWTSIAQFRLPVLYLGPWDENLAKKEGTLHVCGELCAQKLQSQFMGNVRQNHVRRRE